MNFAFASREQVASRSVWTQQKKGRNGEERKGGRKDYLRSQLLIHHFDKSCTASSSKPNIESVVCIQRSVSISSGLVFFFTYTCCLQVYRRWTAGPSLQVTNGRRALTTVEEDANGACLCMSGSRFAGWTGGIITRTGNYSLLQTAERRNRKDLISYQGSWEVVQRRVTLLMWILHYSEVRGKHRLGW